MKKRYIVPFIFIVVVFDQITKYLASALISPLQTVKILPFLNLVNVRNTGSAFGMFRSLGNEIFIIISLAAIAVIVLLLVKEQDDRLGLSLVLSGAAGNLIDRIFFGSVMDFIDFFVSRFHWPAFNIADSAITIGIGLILIKILRSPTKEL